MSTRIALLFFLSFLHLSVCMKRRDPLRDYAKLLTTRNPLAKSLGVAHLTRIQRKLLKKGSCSSRICFAIDGSDSISRPQFMLQKDFIKLIASLAALDSKARFSAVQYGLANIEISKQTKDLSLFVLKVIGSRQARAPKTFLAAGLAYCISTLQSSRGRHGKKIIVLGDGRSNFAGGAIRSVVKKIDDEVVIAVAIGFPRHRKTLAKIIAKNSGKIFRVKRYLALNNAVEGVLFSACE